MKCFLRVTEGTLTNCALIGTGLGAMGQKIMDPVSPSHQLCWAWAPFKGHVTPADQSQTLLLRAATTPRLWRTRGLRCCTVQKEKY